MQATPCAIAAAPRRANRWPVFVFALALCLGALSPTHASPILPQIPAGTQLAPSSAIFVYDWYRYYFDTDSGKIYRQYSNYPWEELAVSTGSLIPQTGGPNIRVWDFSTFEVPANFRVDILGSLPAGIRAQNSISIAGRITVTAGGQPGGTGGQHNVGDAISGADAVGLTGGKGGAGLGGLVRDSTGFLDTAHAGAGGGGGFASAGQPGFSGKSIIPHVWNGTAWAPDGPAIVHPGGVGGAAYATWSILNGGGGGGGGGAGIRYGGGHHGGNGGNGGGAIMFVTPQNFTLTSTGELHADGQEAAYFDGSDADSSGGGGAGGYVAFAVTGTWTNQGVISARGAAGRGFPDTNYQRGGAGSGGYIDIDPSTIINQGTIDVSSGADAGDVTYGGTVVLAAQSVVNSGSIAGSAQTITVPPSLLSNMSVRSVAGSGDRTLIVGLSIGGTGEKQVLLRGIGPTLATFGVSNVLADPRLRLFSGSTEVGGNDNWGGTSEFKALGASVSAFTIPDNSMDAVLAPNLAPGVHSVHVNSDAASGVTLVEAYDTGELDASARLINISARTEAGTGDNVLIVGFYIRGTLPKTVLIRGIGPTLASFNVSGVLADPVLELYSGDELIDQNDNWGGGTLLTDAFGSTNAFNLAADSADAALLVSLPPGGYTAHVKGKNDALGVALVEVYEVP